VRGVFRFFSCVFLGGVSNFKLEEEGEVEVNSFSSNFMLDGRQSQITGRTTLELPKLLFYWNSWFS
jgi:hypothetical protein